MEKFFEKAKKELTLELHSAMKMTKIKGDDDEDFDYVLHMEKLNTITSKIKHLKNSLNKLCENILKISNSSHLAVSAFTNDLTPDCIPYFANAERYKNYLNNSTAIIEGFSKSEIPIQCIAPLNNCLQRIEKIKAIDQKRKKNKILLDNAKQGTPEYDKRERKYINLNDCFLRSVDILEKILPSVFSSVFLSFDCFVHDLVTKENFEMNKYLSDFTPQTEMAKMATLIE
ncbi:hypothetical protein GPJ56_009486 [Histomonas meleagridis]|uniref:uncharacterized protein n=1 Tax=Histomonas meleagridis TaxID=135588 RepID=UPI003559D481|nr:hypothetical protein GPJ56_009486 [Histomonas meleagridis]KAH0804627.1 hypothetical protein GO595_002563 [Histomonas meleagridis]